MFTREDDEYDRFRDINERVSALTMREMRSGSWFRVVMGVLMQVGPLLIYFAGGLIIIGGYDRGLTVGTVTATVTLVNRLYRPVEGLLNLQVNFTRSLAMFTRIFDYLDRPQRITSPADGVRPDLSDATVTFDHVAFGYEEGTDLVLTDVNLEVPAGRMYAIVGPSGSGKSTLVNLIPRLFDVTSGSVRVADVDVRSFDLTYLRANIGVVTQEAYLFNGTILDNLRYARPDATMDQIEQACRVASIHDFIVAQPKGYETEVGNRGLKLSGGEKQRLSLARVVLKDPKVLILDEATSALDSISENAIQEALEQLMVGRTTLVIAHRLTTVLKADAICVVGGGTIAERGTHEELIALGGTYRELYETQFKHVIDTGRGPSSALDIHTLSSTLDARELGPDCLTEVFSLARSNRAYYRRLGECPTKANLAALFGRLPAEANPTERHLVGFYGDDGRLVAVMDLTLGWPERETAFIGWFMVAADMQRQGIGSQLVADLRATLEASGIAHVELKVPERDRDGIAFWTGQGFSLTGERDDSHRHTLVTLGRAITT